MYSSVETRNRVLCYIGNTSRKLLDVFFPIECLECKQYGAWICEYCFGKIPITVKQWCPGCGAENSFGNTCVKCVARGSALDGLLVAAEYEYALVKEAVRSLKYLYVQGLAELLGTLMVEQYARYGFDDEWWISVPVPLHARRLCERGFNQSELLSRVLEKKLGIPYVCALRRNQWTIPQVELKGDDRRKNLHGVFECINKESVHNRRILLIDDVATTGSTLEECARILKQVGACRVWGFVVAKG